jgi:thiol-disulfide isomerase/thioredoxin
MTAASSSNVTVCSSNAQFQKLVSSSPNDHGAVVVVNFWAPWAAPCTQMNAVFEELSKRHVSLSFVKVFVILNFLSILTIDSSPLTIGLFLMY